MGKGAEPMKISVCMAVYNGEKYILSQINSILPQLSSGDELIISDDGHGGETERIIREAAASDPRVIYIKGPSKGVVSNFENAIGRASGDVIFLSDQDDVWCIGKVPKVLSEIECGADLVLHDAKLTDENLNVTDGSYFEVHKSRQGFLSNFIRNSYMGCCMAFTREIADKSVPFPKGIPMHDQWIGLVAEREGKVCFLKEALILHRQHGNNVTGGKTSLRQKLAWRLILIRALIFKK